MEFWNNYKKLVDSQKLRQEWIAEKSGMNYAAYRAMCSKEPDIRLSTALKLARVVGASIDYLADGKDDLSFEDRELLTLAKRHCDLLHDVDVLPPDKLEFIKMQVKSVADFVRQNAEKIKEAK